MGKIQKFPYIYYSILKTQRFVIQYIIKSKKGGVMCNRHGEGLATFVLGALIGAAVGVLFAPAKGETTRKKLKKWAENTYEDGKEEFLAHTKDLREKVLGHAKDVKGKVAQAKEALAERAGALKERFGEKAEEFKQIAEEKTEDLRNKAADGLEKAAKKLR